MFESHRGSIVTLLRELIAKSSLSELRHAREEPRGPGPVSVGRSPQADPGQAPRARAGLPSAPQPAITGTDLRRSRSRQSSPGPSLPAGPGSGPGTPTGRAPFLLQKHPPYLAAPAPPVPASPGLRYHRRGTYLKCPRCHQPPSLAGSPLIPKRRIPPCLPPSPSRLRPLHFGAGARPPPLALSIAHFGSSGARLTSRKNSGILGAAFLFPFPSSSPTVPAWKRGCKREKGVTSCREGLFQEKKKS